MVRGIIRIYIHDHRYLTQICILLNDSSSNVNLGEKDAEIKKLQAQLLALTVSSGNAAIDKMQVSTVIGWQLCVVLMSCIS